MLGDYYILFDGEHESVSRTFFWKISFIRVFCVVVRFVFSIEKSFRFTLPVLRNTIKIFLHSVTLTT